MQYLPGAGFVVVRGDLLALLTPRAPEDLVHRLWELGAGPVRHTAVLGAILARGFDAVGDFGYAVTYEGTTTVVLRGDVGVALEDSGSTSVLAGTGVDTWFETTVPPGSTLTLFGGSTPPAGSGLPVESGVVRALAITSSSTTADLPPVSSAPGPLVLPSAPTIEPLPATPPPPVAVVPPPPVPVPVPPPVASLAEVLPPARVTTPIQPQPVEPEQRQDEPQQHHVEPQQHLAEPVTTDQGPPESEPALYLASLVAPPAPPAPPEATAASEDADDHTLLATDLPVLRAVDPPVLTTPRHHIRLVTGERVPLDRPVLVGRAPHHAATGPNGGPPPRLLVVPSPSGDISRTHARLDLSDGRVLVTDLDSTNGLQIRHDYRPPVRPRPGVPTAVDGGSVIDLGDGVLLTIEVDA